MRARAGAPPRTITQQILAGRADDPDLTYEGTIMDASDVGDLPGTVFQTGTEGVGERALLGVLVAPVGTGRLPQGEDRLAEDLGVLRSLLGRLTHSALGGLLPAQRVRDGGCSGGAGGVGPRGV